MPRIPRSLIHTALATAATRGKAGKAMPLLMAARFLSPQVRTALFAGTAAWSAGKYLRRRRAASKTQS